MTLPVLHVMVGLEVAAAAAAAATVVATEDLA